MNAQKEEVVYINHDLKWPTGIALTGSPFTSRLHFEPASGDKSAFASFDLPISSLVVVTVIRSFISP